MALSDADVQKFEQALRGPAPAWDPGWRISLALLDLVRVQAAAIRDLQMQLAVAGATQSQLDALLCKAIRAGGSAAVKPSTLAQGDVDAAIGDLNSAIQAAQNGQQCAQYAGAILKFVAKVVV